MKQKWSAEWKSSNQPRKQRKYRHNAPLHIRHKFLGARLSSEYTRQFGRRTLPIRKGDEVRLMRGSRKGLKGVVDRIDLKKSKVYVDGIIVKKVDGSEVMKPLQPSNLMITKPGMDDKKRQIILERTENRAKETRSRKDDKKRKDKVVKPEEKPKEKPKPKEKGKEAEKKTDEKTENKKEDAKEPKKEEKPKTIKEEKKEKE